jgi:hypothetical protein
MDYKLSIVIAVFESYEATRRQALYFSKMNLPDNIEFVFVDDGSEPEHPAYPLKNLTMVYTHDTRPWTQGIARNVGVRAAKGKYVLCTDIDHILSYEAIMYCYNYEGYMVIFPRYLGVLTEDGTFTQDIPTMIEYGLDPARPQTRRGLYASFHGNTYCMLRETFWELGGNDESHCVYGHHAPNRHGEDAIMTNRWNHWANAKGIKADVGPKIYTFTNGRYNVNGDPNPKGLFHTLSYEQPTS